MGVHVCMCVGMCIYSTFNYISSRLVVCIKERFWILYPQTLRQPPRCTPTGSLRKIDERTFLRILFTLLQARNLVQLLF